MGRERKKIAAEVADVDGEMRHGLRPVDEHDSPGSAGARAHLLRRVHHAEHVGDVAERDDPRVWAKLGGEVVQQRVAGVVDPEMADARAGLRGDHLPRHHVRRVPGEPDEDLVARLEVGAAPRRRDEVDRFRRAAREDDLTRVVGVDELADAAARPLVRLRGSSGEGVERGARIGVVHALVTHDRADHGIGAKRRGRRVEVRERMPVDPLVERGKVRPPPFDLVRGLPRHCRHAPSRRGRGRAADRSDEIPPLHALHQCDTVESMKDTTESSAQEGRRWLLLIHQVPPKPDYLRVKVRRRLQKLGAAPLKSSVYVLPDTEEHLEDFQWLANEIIAEGGDATICSATLLSGVSDEELETMFGTTTIEGSAPRPSGSAPVGATWVTRQGVFVDRIASAWLIKRFIDPRAQLRFVPARGYKPKAGELRFDMYQGEYTHVGDRCTFETLLREFDLDDKALAAIAEIVHDIDCKDEKFERAEVPGVHAVLQGIANATDDDLERVKRGAQVFDGLYEQLR